MRLIGHLTTEANAKILGDYLSVLDIKNVVEPDGEGWALWIYSEDQLEAGRIALEDYRKNPSDAKFSAAQAQAAAVTARTQREQKKFNARVHTADRIWVAGRIGKVTLFLIIGSVLVTILQLTGIADPVLELFYISLSPVGVLPEVLHGQIWRLITPIFIHFTIIHILFNMMMLRDLGSLVESRQGAKALIWLVVVLGVGSNLGQYFYNGPAFGGMSGVLYGLLGYIWIRGHMDPASGLYLTPMTLGIMLVWFFLCLANVISSVANGCHVIGLLLGMIIGATPIGRRTA